MKLFPKDSARDPLEAWSPPALGSESEGLPHTDLQEQASDMFRRDNIKYEETRHIKASFASHPIWEPGAFDDEPSAFQIPQWSFMEIVETPAIKESPSLVFPQESSLNSERARTEREVNKIISRARAQAEEIILAAQMQADEVLMQAQMEIDEQKNEGRSQGRNEVFAAIGDSVKATSKMFEEITAWKAELFSQGNQILIEMMKDLSKKMFGEGAKLDSAALHANLTRIMDNAHGLGALKIFLNPEDARLLDPSWSEQQILIVGEHVKVIPSNNITRGGCLIKGNMGTVDASVETQLGAILKSFDETPDSSR